MAYEPLHHKYRPQTFRGLVGQDAIATTLGNAIRQRRIAPAYLFSGPRGTGKTSSARILAKSLNCIKGDLPTEDPCGVCEVCRAIAQGSAMDVIEIDAASNTGVDNIREIIERAQFAPVQCRYKVYVIDECHMLSTAAFNALLKTLEEPPAHVVFVLATTDPQRVLPTIISRCQRFDFRRIPLEAMVGHLMAIAEKESIDVTEEAVRLVAQVSQGGLRDAESLLDQLSLLDGQVTVDRVWDLVGAVPERDLLALAEAIAADDATRVLDDARHLMDRGREPLIVLQNLASFYRDLLIAKTAPDRPDLVALTPPTWQRLCAFVQSLDLGVILRAQQHLRASEGQVKNTTQPRLWLEVTLLGLLPSALSAAPVPVTAAPGAAQTPRPIAAPAPAPIPAPVTAPAGTPAPAPTTEAVSRSEPAPTPASTVAPAPEPSPEPAVAAAPSDRPEAAPIPDPIADLGVDLGQIWQQIITNLQPRGTQELLRQQCRLVFFQHDEARLGVSSQPLFRMVQERLPNVEEAFLRVFDRKVRVSLEVRVAQKPGPPAAAPPGQRRSPDPAPVTARSAPPSPSFTPTPPPEERPAPPPLPPRPELSETLAQAPPEARSPDPEPAPAAALQNGWQEEDPVTRAAKSLAQFFKGEVVLDDGEEDFSPSELAAQPAEIGEMATLPEEDEDELPF